MAYQPRNCRVLTYHCLHFAARKFYPSFLNQLQFFIQDPRFDAVQNLGRPRARE